MKTLFISLAILLFSCQPDKPQQRRYTYTHKIIKAKNQAQETSYSYQYNVWKGNFYQQPDIHSVYYIVYKDGSYDRVDVGKFSISNIGDTVSIPHIEYY